jgi:SAM-dependent methyltransferase
MVAREAAIEPNAVYALGASGGESARLQRQAEELLPESRELIDATGLEAGQSAIDLGCGPCGIIDLLAERVSPGGTVVGLDADPAMVKMASEYVTNRRLAGVEVTCGDARSSGLPCESFDLVHARTLLINVPEPQQIVGEMVRLARPGGWVVGLEPDIEHVLCHPPNAEFERLCEIFRLAHARNGADHHIGRRLPELYRSAGLIDVTVQARTALYPVGHSRRTIRPDLVRSIRPHILRLGIADERELDRLDAAARTHLADPDVLVMPSLNFLAWGRKTVAA